MITVDPAPRASVDEALAKMEKLDFLVDQPLALPLEAGLEG